MTRKRAGRSGLAGLVPAAGALLALLLVAGPAAQAQQPAGTEAAATQQPETGQAGAGQEEAGQQPVAEELEMIPGQVARLQTLDKISARISTIEVPVGGTVSWERLDISVAKCARSSPFERPERAALVKVTEKRRGLAPVEVFSGWMFASSPALHAVEHPVYDVLVIDCMTWAAAGKEPADDGAGDGTDRAAD
ncbi:MAG: DUF2155 domain-containing protein [Sneathiellaceae bacterium]